MGNDSFSLMKSGKLYLCTDPALMALQSQCMERQYDYNRTRPRETARRTELLRGIFGAVGKNCCFEPPLHANWGINTRVGDGVYANFNLTLVDDADVEIGSFTMIGPNVVIATAQHPVDADGDGAIDDADEPLEVDPGGYVCVCTNNLTPIMFTLQPAGLTGRLTLSATMGGDRIRVWWDAGRMIEVPLTTGAVPSGPSAPRGSMACVTGVFGLNCASIVLRALAGR
jgi:hypothetical protein